MYPYDFIIYVKKTLCLEKGLREDSGVCWEDRLLGIFSSSDFSYFFQQMFTVFILEIKANCKECKETKISLKDI